MFLKEWCRLWWAPLVWWQLRFLAGCSDCPTPQVVPVFLRMAMALSSAFLKWGSRHRPVGCRFRVPLFVSNGQRYGDLHHRTRGVFHAGKRRLSWHHCLCYRFWAFLLEPRSAGQWSLHPLRFVSPPFRGGAQPLSVNILPSKQIQKSNSGNY